METTRLCTTRSTCTHQTWATIPTHNQVRATNYTIQAILSQIYHLLHHHHYNLHYHHNDLHHHHHYHNNYHNHYLLHDNDHIYYNLLYYTYHNYLLRKRQIPQQRAPLRRKFIKFIPFKCIAKMLFYVFPSF